MAVTYLPNKIETISNENCESVFPLMDAKSIIKKAAENYNDV